VLKVLPVRLGRLGQPGLLVELDRLVLKARKVRKVKPVQRAVKELLL
jgi:hypothetical protein